MATRILAAFKNQFGRKYRVMSNFTVERERSPGKWKFERRATIAEFQFSRERQSNADDRCRSSQRAEAAENQSAEIAGDLAAAVNALEDLSNIVTDEMGELEGGSEPEDLEHWLSAVKVAKSIIEKAKAAHA